jgi:hypothetical protein
MAPAELDLFLLAGQSNMAGRGEIEAQDRVPIEGVLALNKELAWGPAVDPLHWDKPIAAVGLGRSFAATLQKYGAARQVGLIPAAFGGTSLEEWKVGGKLFADAITRARAAAPVGRLRGILWHQGEAESAKEETARTYGARFAVIVAALRAELGAPDLPLVVGQLGGFYKGQFAPVVNEQLATAPLWLKHTGFVSSAGLGHKGDEVHFDSAGLRELGRRYALAWMAL